jgi:hypothetical protein
MSLQEQLLDVEQKIKKLDRENNQDEYDRLMGIQAGLIFLREQEKQAEKELKIEYLQQF